MSSRGSLRWCQPLFTLLCVIGSSQSAKSEPVTEPVLPQDVKTTPFARKQAGWNCAADPQTGQWDCTLIGPDPKGRPYQVDDGTQLQNQERLAPGKLDENRRYRSMLNEIPVDPWQSCAMPARLGPSIPLPATPVTPEKLPVDIQADYTDVFEEEIITFSGNVEVQRGDQKVLADKVSYDTVTEELNARGHVHYRGTGLSLFSDSAFMNFDTSQGHLRHLQYIYDSAPARGSASFAKIESKAVSRYRDVSYTTCQPGDDDWQLKAKYLELDKASGTGIARQAWLEFQDIPFLYTPYLSFPLDDRRKSGFLTPNFTTSSISGFNISAPYYWNIAPNFDATFRPRLLTRRGVLLGGDFRYLTDISRGEIGGEWLPYDLSAKSTRGQLFLLNHTQFRPNLVADLDLNYISDDQYQNEIGDALRVTNNSHVRSQATIRYVTDNLSLLGRLENYQTIASQIPAEDRPYRRLPQIVFNFQDNILDSGARMGLQSEFVYFQREKRINGQRFNISPSLSWPLRSEALFLVPKVAVQHTQYWLEDQRRPMVDDRARVQQYASSIGRTLPIVSLDGGAFLEKDLTWGGSPLVQTLEPRFFYVYIPEVDQGDIPVFDTTNYDFRFSQLFRENRFVGVDRVGDSNQITLALTSRILDPVLGQERLRASLGQIFYFQDRKVTLPEQVKVGIPAGLPGSGQVLGSVFTSERAENDFTSSLIGELDLTLTPNWSFRSSAQWEPDENHIQRAHAAFQYNDKAGRILNLGYRYRRNNIRYSDATLVSQGIPIGTLTNEDGDGVSLDGTPFKLAGLPSDSIINQTDVSFRWPITSSLSAVGRWQYSFLGDTRTRTRESFLGLEAENCCWRFRIIGRHWVNDANNKPDDTVYLELELKGLTYFGDRVERFLERNIVGYRVPE